MNLRDVLLGGSCYVSENVSLSGFCTYGVAGVARFLAKPANILEVREVMLAAKSFGAPVIVLGGGSNVLLSDIDGIVIISDRFCDLNWQKDTDSVIVEIGSGYPLRRLVKEALLRELTGLEFAVGIPGSVGGAVMGNAGTQGNALSDSLLWVESVEPDGQVLRIHAHEIESGYRFSSLSRGLRFLTKCAFRLKNDNLSAVKERCAENWRRRASQPFLLKSAGCVFKNPAGDFAGRLLDECGCKGMKIGGAKISESHANFLINYDNASVDDIKSLIDTCRSLVLKKKGVLLEPEVKILGFEKN